jgi:hypothetical protein
MAGSCAMRRYYLPQEAGLQTLAQLGAGLQSFLSLQSAGLHSFLASAFLADFLLSEAKAPPDISIRAIMPMIIFFIVND